MSKSPYKAKPLSRADIRREALEWRRVLNLDTELYVDVLRMLELILPFLGFTYDYPSQEEMEEEAKTYPDQKLICIREDVYYGARKGVARYRFTVVHEIAHAILHSRASISFARSDIPLKAYMDPEWQANAFAGEFLMPYNLVKDMTIDEIVETCGVSRKAAVTQMQAYKKNR